MTVSEINQKLESLGVQNIWMLQSELVTSLFEQGDVVATLEKDSPKFSLSIGVPAPIVEQLVFRMDDDSKLEDVVFLSATSHQTLLLEDVSNRSMFIELNQVEAIP